jgi:ATP adenylyltransferase
MTVRKPGPKKRLKTAQAGDRLARPVLQTEHELLQHIRDDIWPVERKTLFNPERLRYVRKLIQPKGCVFCNAVKVGVRYKSLLLYKGKKAIIVLNKYPYNNGHLLVLPRRHCGEFLELSESEHSEINRCLQAAIAALKDAYSPKGFNVGLNLGSAAGAGIPEHLHYHVIPRWTGDTNFFALIADTKVVVETLEQTYRRLVPYFEGSI